MTRTFWAPGRVNLIGEHTDYTGGLALPAAISLGIEITGDAAHRIELRSEGFGPPIDLPSDGGNERVEGFGRYVQAVARELAGAGRAPVGFRGRISSTLPPGAGLSSSAALEIALALTLSAVGGLQLDPTALVLLGQRSEHAAVGVPCGVMDQAASVFGRAGHAILLDTASLEHRYVPLPPELTFTIFDSGIRRRLEESAYDERRREIDHAVGLLGDLRPRDLEPDEAAAILTEAGADARLQRRLRHIVTENARVRAVAEALAADPVDHARLGRLLREGHDSLRDDLEISTPELDLLVDLAYRSGAIAARMMGGGFGGSVIVLTERERAETIVADVVARYRAATGIEAGTYHAEAADGARER